MQFAGFESYRIRIDGKGRDDKGNARLKARLRIPLTIRSIEMSLSSFHVPPADFTRIGSATSKGALLRHGIDYRIEPDRKYL